MDNIEKSLLSSEQAFDKLFDLYNDIKEDKIVFFNSLILDQEREKQQKLERERQEKERLQKMERERLYRIILVLFTIIAMIVSYYTQKLSDGVYILCGGFILSLLLCLPSWPMYNRQQLKWLKPKEKPKDD